MRLDLLLQLPAEILEKMLGLVRDRVGRTLMNIRLTRIMKYNRNYNVMMRARRDRFGFVYYGPGFGYQDYLDS